MAIELVPLATASLTINPELQVLAMRDGSSRVIAEITGAEWSGERLTARQKGVAAADWAVIGADGVTRIDVRSTLETHDGALIYVSYKGRAISGGSGQILWVTPLFETGDPRYEWLNAIQAVAKAEFAGGALTYDIYEVR